MIDAATRDMLDRYASRYETEDFLIGDPSWFMHQVEGDANREAVAFVASCLSFGSRKQFMPKIQAIVDCAGGNVDLWIREGRFARTFPKSCGKCFYRFFTEGDMRDFLEAYRRLMAERGEFDYLSRVLEAFDSQVAEKLNTTFRSSPKLVDAFNKIFGDNGGADPSWFEGMKEGEEFIRYEGVESPEGKNKFDGIDVNPVHFLNVPENILIAPVVKPLNIPSGNVVNPVHSRNVS